MFGCGNDAPKSSLLPRSLHGGWQGDRCTSRDGRLHRRHRSKALSVAVEMGTTAIVVGGPADRPLAASPATTPWPATLSTHSIISSKRSPATLEYANGRQATATSTRSGTTPASQQSPHHASKHPFGRGGVYIAACASMRERRLVGSMGRGQLRLTMSGRNEVRASRCATAVVVGRRVSTTSVPIAAPIARPPATSEG